MIGSGPLLALLLSGSALSLDPRPALSLGWFSKEDPRVRAGNAAFAAGKYDEALKGYEDALRDHPNAPELQFDRGNALFKLNRAAEAREAYLSALAAKDASLKSQDYFNMGNALWQLDKNDEAALAYQRALLLNPGFEEARHNLELLLAPPPDAGGGDAGQDGGADGGAGDGGGDAGNDGGSRGDGGRQPDAGEQSNQGDAGAPPRDAGSPPPPKPEPQRPDGGVAKPQQLDKLQAEQLLDALRQREKNLQLWKFRTKQQRGREAEKDW